MGGLNSLFHWATFGGFNEFPVSDESPISHLNSYSRSAFGILQQIGLWVCDSLYIYRRLYMWWIRNSRVRDENLEDIMYYGACVQVLPVRAYEYEYIGGFEHSNWLYNSDVSYMMMLYNVYIILTHSHSVNQSIQFRNRFWKQKNKEKKSECG